MGLLDIVFRYNNRITALIVTLVILIILATVSISAILGENGLIKKAQEVKSITEQAVANESEELTNIYSYMEGMLGKNLCNGSYNKSKGHNVPDLSNGKLIPIKWNGSRWIETTPDDSEWYNYSEKKWANAKTEDGSMWVWIPRFAYKITNGYHQSGSIINSDMPALGAGNIEIEFIKGTSNEGARGEKIVEYTQDTTLSYTKFPEAYVIHSAFNYGDTVPGMWVAKFEASQSDAGANSYDYQNYTGGTSEIIKIQPGVNSWRNLTIGDMYEKCLNYNKELNSHLMKNDEWGAVAYLSKSKYGKEEEVWTNPNSDCITGQAGNSGASELTKTTFSYDTEEGKRASTTGNIYGIYDMCGGSYEYVAAYLDNDSQKIYDNAKSLYEGEEKTKNIYLKGNEDTAEANFLANKNVYGDAIYETSVLNNNAGDCSWYADFSYFICTDKPFFLRGGSYTDTTGSGMFSYMYEEGGAYRSVSFRPVLTRVP